MLTHKYKSICVHFEIMQLSLLCWERLDLKMMLNEGLLKVHYRKSANIFVFILKYYVEDYALKHLLIFEICAREIRVESLFTNIQKYVKNKPTFLKNWQTSRANNWIILGIKNAKFSRYIENYREILKLH